MVWYYVKDGARQGPVEEAEINGLAAIGTIRPETLVWHEGLPEWRPYSAVAPAPPPPAPAPVPAPAPAPAAYSLEYTPGPVQQVVAAAQEPEPQPEPEPEPERVPQQEYAPAAAVVPAAAAVQMYYCSQCGRQYPSEELVRFGTATICANCKDIYAQRLRETGQVSGTRVYGGFWIRFGAAVIDGILIGIANFALQSVFSLRMTNPNPADIALLLSTLGMSFSVSIILNALYEAFFLVQYGATPGKMVCHLKVITPDGGGLTWGRALGRHFAKFLSGITLLIGYIMAGFDNEKRALHDYIAGTRVIRV
jgi:uncharacterized RDD family membrane protein YckC